MKGGGRVSGSGLDVHCSCGFLATVIYCMSVLSLHVESTGCMII